MSSYFEWVEGFYFAEKKMLNRKREHANEMAQQVEALTAKSDNLCLSPGLHKVEGESQLSHCPLTSKMAHTHTETHIKN